jgi:hypothetical protein
MKSIIIVWLLVAIIVAAVSSIVPSITAASTLFDFFCNSVRLGIASGPQQNGCLLQGAQQLLQQTTNPLTTAQQQQLQSQFIPITPINPVVPVVPVTTVLTQPIANAGPSQTVSEGAAVTLSGSASAAGSTITTPPGTINQGTIIAYSWSQVSGVPVTLSAATTVSPTFTAPTTSATLVFSLRVTDSLGLTSAPATVIIQVT